MNQCWPHMDGQSISDEQIIGGVSLIYKDLGGQGS